MRFLRSFPLLIALPLLVGFAWLGWELRAAAPSFSALKSILVAPRAEGVMLGHRELLQRPGYRSAAERHLEVRFADGQWSFANKAPERRVDAPTNRTRTRHVRRWRLADGDRIVVGPVSIEVERPAPGGLVLTAGKQRAVWKDERLDTGQEVWVECSEDPHPLRRVLQPWMAADKERRLFSIGGAVDCASRWALSGIPSRGLNVVEHLGDLWLTPGSIEREARLFHAGEEEQAFQDLRLPLSGPDGTVRKLIIGRTHYGVRPRDNGLRLAVLTGADSWHPDRIEDQEQLAEIDKLTARQQIERETESHRWIGGGLGAMEWARKPWQWLAVAAGSALAALIGVGIVRGRLAYDQLEAARRWALQWPLPLFALVLTIALWRTGDSDLGLLMGATAGGGTGRALLRFLLLGLVAALLILQLPLGSEHGLFGVQPVEAAKLALLLVLAFLGMHVEEVGFVGAQQYRESPLSLLWGLALLLFGVLLLLLIPLVGVRDLSPVLLMAILLLAWGLHITPALPTGYRWLLRGFMIAVVALIFFGALTLYADPESLPDALAAVVPEDRFRVWGQPWRFPHSGAQLLQALDLGAAGGLWGAGEGWSGWTGWNLTGWTIGKIGTFGWFGLNGAVMTLPEVHNDFIATFFIHHFGIISALALLAVQILVLVLLFNTGDRARRWGLEGNLEERQAGRVLALAIHGFSWLLAGHWLIAWGNVLGVLPVMGQPMSWLAAANSHSALFVLPGTFIALTCAWMLLPGASDDAKALEEH